MASDVKELVASHVLRRLLEERLKDTRAPTSASEALPAGVTQELQSQFRSFFPPAPIAAAVLVPIVEHADELTVLLTERATHLRQHAGQISFPGGRIEPDDLDVVQAALRESEEEIGLSREHVTFAGFLEPQLVLSGFWITPVVGFVRPGFELHLDPREVASTFEVPLAHILDPGHHRSRERLIGSTQVQVYDIPFGERHIWGATAAILLSLCKKLE
jgi:8-oxo-dGTP pyrophosphatase MutT (NUDIX family)